MSLSRRSFVGALGLAGAGIVSAPLVAARGREAFASLVGELPSDLPELSASPRLIRIGSNENPRGPSDASLDALRGALGEAGRYQFNLPDDLRKELAASLGVGVDNLILGCGSTEVLHMAVHAFTSPTRALVTASPTYEYPTNRCTQLGHEVRAVPVRTDDLRLDLATMAARSRGAGLVFVNNPNNPTGTVHSAAVMKDFIKRVFAEQPDATILIDEAYHEYVEDPAYASAAPLALENPRVIVSRTFSKVYGLAGLRVGYGIMRPETREQLARHQLNLSLNVLGSTAARAALTDRALVGREQRLNHEAREHTRRFFQSAGYRVSDSQTNFLMADIRRDTKEFQEACRKLDVLVGRPFPPLATWARVSIGTLDEMQAATEVFKRVLAGGAATN